MKEHQAILRVAAESWLDDGNTPYYEPGGKYSTSGNPFLGDAERAVLEAARARGLDQAEESGPPRRALPTETRTEVVVRSGGLCEWVNDGERCTDPAGPIHHRLPWAKGGSHDPTNLVHLCAHHHRLVHSPDGRQVAYDLGFLLKP